MTDKVKVLTLPPRQLETHIREPSILLNNLISFLECILRIREFPCDNCADRVESLDNAYDASGNYIGGCYTRAASTTKWGRFLRALNGCTVQRPIDARGVR